MVYLLWNTDAKSLLRVEVPKKLPNFQEVTGGTWKYPTTDQQRPYVVQERGASPRNTITTPRQQRDTMEASPAQQGSRRGGICSRYRCPRKKARGESKRGFRHRAKKGIQKRGGCSLEWGWGGRWQRWASQFGQGLLAETVPLPAGAPQSLVAAAETQPKAQEAFLLRGPSDGAGPGSGPRERGKGPGPQHGKHLLLCPLGRLWKALGRSRSLLSLHLGPSPVQP